MASAISFPNDGDIKYHFVDWLEWGNKAYELASKILAEKKQFDRIIALATGGLTLSRAMKDYLNIPRISSLHISFYQGIEGIDSHSKTPVITQSSAFNLQGERILIFDDINDTGATIKTAVQYLNLHGADQITTATIFQKPTTLFPSDYFAGETSDWIIFPDEIRETIELLNTKWTKQGISSKVIESRLLEIGFSRLHIKLIKG